jgi:hypothetical protein
MGCNSRILKRSFSNLESMCLGPSTPEQTTVNNFDQIEQVFKRPLEILASTSSSTQDFMQHLTQIQSTSNDKLTCSFKKIAPKYQRMLLLASSQGEAIPSELGKEATEFFSQSTVLNAQIYLNSHLEALKIECSVSSALATSLMHGSLLWVNSLTPSGLASSVISSLDIIRADVPQEGIVLDYSTKFEISSKSLDKLTKTQILFPSDIEASIERLRALHALVELFFGPLSFASQGLKKLVHLCIDHKHLLRTKNYLDDMFIPKLHFTVDDRLNQWLDQCCRVDLAIDTNLELTNFSSIFYNIQLSKFHCSLPSNILKLHNPSDNNDKSDTSKIEERRRSDHLDNLNKSEIRARSTPGNSVIMKNGTPFSKTNQEMALLFQPTASRASSFTSRDCATVIVLSDAPIGPYWTRTKT